MELRSYIKILRRRIWVVVFTAIVAASAAAYLAYLMPPRYVASATLWVPTTADVGSVRTGEVPLADRLMNTYAALATSGPVLRELQARLGIPADEIENSISVASVPLTELLRISVSDADPARASLVATNLAEILVKQTLATRSGRDRRISLFAPAGIPTTPTWMGMFATTLWRELNIGLGLLLGLIAGVALAFLYDYIDSRLYTKEAIEEAAQLQALGEIPLSRRPAALLNGHSTQQGEAFRYLRTTVFFANTPLPRTLLVTSAMPGEGKSTVVANLALALAQAQQNVIVVDADLRLPSIHRLFNLPNETGLSNVLRQECTWRDALQQTSDPKVRVMTSGPVVANPGELLDTPQFATFIDSVQSESDVVLLDSPAALPVSDAAVIAPQVNGVLLVVSRALSGQDSVRTARDQLQAVGANLVGIVVNRTDQVDSHFRRYASSGAGR
jgi:non-specific protein-tyrosine kinase